MLDTGPSQADAPQLRDYLRPIVRWRWLIVAIVIVVTAGTYVYYSQQDEVYEASTQVLLTGGVSPLDPSGTELSDRTLQDQATLLTSRDVAEAVARRTDLGEVGELAASVDATSEVNSSFLTIRAEWGNPEDAARLANAFATTFIDLRSEAERDAIQRSIRAAENQLDQLPRGASAAAERAELRDAVRRLRLQLATASGSATQVDPALPSADPAGPFPRRNAAIMFFVALIAAVGLAYALEAVNRRITRLEDFPDRFGLPLLSVIPEATRVHEQQDGRAAVPSDLVETFRQLRTALQLMAIDRPFKFVLVTSSVAGEGKSTVVCNLAITLRESGLRVAAVDSDLRRPMLAELFGMNGAAGLTTVLTRQSSLSEALRPVAVKADGLGTLARIGSGDGEGAREAQPACVSVLASGPQPPDPQAVLGSDQTRRLLTELGESHDVVLIDSPPMLAVSDAATIAPWVDAVVVVSRYGRATRDDASRLTDLLGSIPDANPVGLVVNSVPAREARGYGYGYGYSR